MVAIAGHQYLNHPEWLGPYDASPPGGQTSRSASTPLALLLNQLQPTTSSLTNDPQTLDQLAAQNQVDLTLPAPEGPPDGLTDGAATPGSPFASYLESTRFQVRQLPSYPIPEQRPLISPAETPVPGAETTGTGPSPASPLERALGQQSYPATPSPQVGEDDNATVSRDGEPPSPPASAAADSSPPPGSVETQATGAGQTLIPSIPAMAPAPGNTGYTLPRGLQGTPSPVLPPPAPAAEFPGQLDLNPVGSISPGTAGNPGTTGNTAPVLPPPGGGGYIAPQPLPSPSPFTVPRPPGSYTGGGFVYTFSDPNGPVP